MERDRREFSAWLVTSPSSPYAALTQRPIGPGLSVGPGPDSELELAKAPRGRFTERSGTVFLEAGRTARPLPRGRLMPLGPYRVMAAGPAGRATLIVYGEGPRGAKPPEWYPFDGAAVYTVTLSPPAESASRRLLAPDGQEVTATEAGTVRVTVNDAAVSLTVRRLPEADAEESSLEIYFRDGTNGSGTYPAGRFVSLEPLGDNRYRLDFNRARNPFCAYSSVFACPAPWRGNVVPSPVAAGERYSGGGLALPQEIP